MKLYNEGPTVKFPMPRTTKLPFHQVAQWATCSVAAHAEDFARALAAHFGVSRAAAGTVIRQLEDSGFVVRRGSSTRPVFSAGHAQWISREYDLPDLDEGLAWERDFSPFIALPPNVKNIVHHGFTEIVNNANDHSGGRRVHVEYQNGLNDWCSVLVIDDGIGAFKKIADALSLPDYRLSLLELSKGKFTSDATNHSGEGIFFTSQMFDEFHLEANQLAYDRYEGWDEGRLDEEHFSLEERSGQPLGTTVLMSINPGTSRTARQVFERFTPDVPDDFSFSRTVVPVRLAALGGENLLSRSQAKRLVARIDQFKKVELDFSNVDEIGQAFADEVFRVFARAHPHVDIVPVNANTFVQGMIRRIVG